MPKMAPKELANSIKMFRSMTDSEALEAAQKYIFGDIKAVLLVYKNTLMNAKNAIQAKNDILAMFAGRNKYKDILPPAFNFKLLWELGVAGKKIKIAFEPEHIDALITAYASRLKSMGIEDEHCILPVIPIEEKKKNVKSKKS